MVLKCKYTKGLGRVVYIKDFYFDAFLVFNTGEDDCVAVDSVSVLSSCR